MGLKASAKGKKAIREAMRDGNFRIDGHIKGGNCPLVEFEKLAKYTISDTTWTKFQYGTRKLSEKNFNFCCAVLGLDPPEIAEPSSPHCLDSAPIELNFYGRTQELQILENWIVRDRCRVILLYGLGGIGKTLLAERLARTVQNQFDQSIWQDFSDAEPIREVITNLLSKVSSTSPPSPSELSTSLPLIRGRLIQALKMRRSLIILNQSWDDGDQAQNESSAMREWLKELSSKAHQSCIVLVTRIKPRDVAEISDGTARSLKLDGLDEDAVCELLVGKEVSCDPVTTKTLIARYCGNPLALKIAASLIKTHYDGDCKKFVGGTIMIPDTIEQVFQEQWQHLSDIQREILKQLAECKEALLKEELGMHLLHQIPEFEIDRAVFDLERRSLLEIVSEGARSVYTLQPVLQRLIQRKRLR